MIIDTRNAYKSMIKMRSIFAEQSPLDFINTLMPPATMPRFAKEAEAIAPRAMPGARPRLQGLTMGTGHAATFAMLAAAARRASVTTPSAFCTREALLPLCYISIIADAEKRTPPAGKMTPHAGGGDVSRALAGSSARPGRPPRRRDGGAHRGVSCRQAGRCMIDETRTDGMTAAARGPPTRAPSPLARQSARMPKMPR